jgi:hypothetical protein
MNMRKNPKNLLRYDYKRSHGWWVRFERKNGNISKFFSDSVHGGRRTAYKEAVEFRNHIRKTLPKYSRVYSPGPGRIKREIRSYITLSGHRAYYDAWVAWIRVSPGRGASTNASIDKWGVREAKKMVLRWLEKKQAEQKRNYARIK